MKKIYSVSSDNINSRLDRWFKKNVCSVPQSLIEKNIRKGNIKVNQRKEKSSYKLQTGDQIIIHNLKLSPGKHKEKSLKYIPTKEVLSVSSNMIVENNNNFVVINKPAGIAVQAGTKSRKNILDILSKMPEFSDSYPYPVHRIDKETTGALIVAKNRKYAQLFTSLFRIRKIYKTYLCIVLGKFTADKGILKDELFYYEGKKKITTSAITHYKVIDSNNSYTFLELKPETGRKHQLRKQLFSRGFPILGDSKYRVDYKYTLKSTNLMLHAHKISFLIDGIKHNFLVDLPSNFKKMLKEKYLKTF